LPERRVAVLGLGNVLMGDDGVGVEVIRRLEEEALPAGVKLVDGGTAAQEALYEAEGYPTVLIVDAAHGGGPPGAVYRVTPGQLRAQGAGAETAVSLHQLSALPALALEELAGRPPGRVVILGVEPGAIACRVGLSDALEAAMPAVVRAVRDEIETETEALEDNR